MILRGAHVVGTEITTDEIVISGAKIVHVGPGVAEAARYGPVLDVHDTIAFPGLFNSHDHLEFNAYPALGHKRYADYVEWGDDIHRRNRDLISSVQRVPKGERLRWGALKNLLSGVTTVAHHGSAEDDVCALPIAIARGTSIHSVRLARHWRWRLNAPIARPPYVVHIGEGTNSASAAEIDELLRWNLLARPLVGVHAVGMRPEQAARFRAVVWCPVSNEFLYGKTADVRALKEATAILFGTDSTLTSDWNFWNHMRRARALAALDDRELFAAVTTTAAGIWGEVTSGRIAAGYSANVVVAKRKAADPWDAFFAVDPEHILLVLRQGVVVLHDASLDGTVLSGPVSAIRVGASEKRVPRQLGGLGERLRARGIDPNFGV